MRIIHATPSQMAALANNGHLIQAHALNLFLDTTISSMNTDAHPIGDAREGFIIPDEVYTFGVDAAGTPYAPLSVRFIHPDGEQTYGSVARLIKELGRLPTLEESERIFRYFTRMDPRSGMPIRCVWDDTEDGYIVIKNPAGISRIRSDQRMGVATNKAFAVVVIG